MGRPGPVVVEEQGSWSPRQDARGPAKLYTLRVTYELGSEAA